MRTRIAALVLLGVAATVAAADPGRPGETFDRQGATISDFGDVGLPPTLADATMTDTLAAAYAQPDTDPTEGGSRTCTLAARNDRGTAGPPPDASQWVHVYVVPYGVHAQNYDRPAVCSDGARMESNIGYANHNIRSWMSRERPANTGIHGKAFRQRTRTVTGYNRTFTFTDVMFLRLHNGPSYYTFALLDQEMRQRGWDLPYTKFVLHYEGQGQYDSKVSASPLGQAPYGGRRAVVYHQYAQRNAQTGAVETRSVRWGCGDGGDVPPLHEALHLWTVVNPTAPDYDTNPAHTPNHTVQTNDVMHWQALSSFTGRAAAGGTTTAGISRLDPGADSYTGRVLQFPAYLTAGPGSGLHTCG